VERVLLSESRASCFAFGIAEGVLTVGASFLMRFRTYAKIPKSLADDPRTAGGIWVALEKLHGAHFVVAVDGADVHFGKRKEWLDLDTPFFGWQLLADELRSRITNIARDVGARFFFAYGELLGGSYPHPDVGAIPGLSAIQTGIWYCPDIRWVVFDMLVADSEEDEGTFLAHGEVETLAAAHGLLVPPLIRRARRMELESVPVRALSRFPVGLGLPSITDNIAEGIILKPDLRMPPSERPVIKRKIPEFDDAKFDESAAWAPGRLSVNELLAWVERLVNPARIQSARSKVGTAREAIVEEVVLDVAVDLELAFSEAWEASGPEGQTHLLDRAKRLAEDLA
jgi:Rnl2 family RNA ligase